MIRGGILWYYGHTKNARAKMILWKMVRNNTTQKVYPEVLKKKMISPGNSPRRKNVINFEL